MPKKVAILGGGVSGLAAALELSDPRHNGAFEVTIHQIGWRLGGKCASGRDMNVSLRIKEHGPHIFLGFYDNAFALLREVYSKLPAGRPFATIEDALVPQSSLATMEQVGGIWLPWVINAPVMPGRPGDPALTGTQVLMRILQWVDSGIDCLNGEPTVGEFPDIADTVFENVSATLQRLQTDVLVEPPIRDIVVAGLKALQMGLHDNWNAIEALSNDIRRIGILIDLGITILLGALVDNLLLPTRASVAAANQIEYSDWLRRHGAKQETITSAVVRALYDTVFGYPNGDVSNPPNAEAGSAFLVQRAMLSYHNVLFWKMGAGTGDIVAAPIYQILCDRGVKIEFFHRVDKLIPSADGSQIVEIQIGRQATVNEPYHPLIDVPGPAGDILPAWPDRPLYDQLKEGAELKAKGIDLESHWTPWTDPESPLVLERDKGDFDIAIVAMPPESLKVIAPDQPPATWSDMFEHVASVQTCSMQMWMCRTLSETGWTALSDPTVSGYDACQLDTWFDASDVLKREGWPAGAAPVQMAMLCGPMPTPLSVPPGSDHDFPTAMHTQALQLATDFLNGAMPLWPHLRTRAGGFDMNALFSPGGAAGPARLQEQYWVAAINPSDRYVQTLVGTSRFRLGADASGYGNLFFCGDWTDYGFNFGCFEGAVMSGLKAANAITKNPRLILNDPFEWK